MFDRYNIVDEADQREAFVRLDGYVSSLPTERKILSFKGGQHTDNSPPAKKKPPKKQGWFVGSAWESNPLVLATPGYRVRGISDLRGVGSRPIPPNGLDCAPVPSQLRHSARRRSPQ